MRKTLRDAENAGCVGALRSPRASLDKVLGSGLVGERLQLVLDGALRQVPEALLAAGAKARQLAAPPWAPLSVASPARRKGQEVPFVARITRKQAPNVQPQAAEDWI